MRIALISYEFPPDTGQGGIGTYVFNASKLLSEHGQYVEVFSGTTKSSYTTVLNNFLTIHRIQITDRVDFSNKVLIFFQERNKINAFNIIEAPEYAADSLEILLHSPEIPQAIKLHTPSFLIQHINNSQITVLDKLRFIAGSLRRFKIPKLYWKAINNADKERELCMKPPILLSPTLALANIISKSWQIERSRIRFLPNVYIPEQSLLNIPTASLTKTNINITFIGRLEIRKGIKPFVQSLKSILKKHNSIKVRFIGKDGPYGSERFNSMSEYINNRLNEYSAALEFIGPIELELIPEYLKEADICVFPSLWENFPNVCLEAMSAGRAIVGSKHGGMSEMLEGEMHGLLCDPYNPKTITDALLKYINDPALRKSKGESARNRVLTAYSEAVIYPQTMAIYQEVIKTWSSQ